MIAHFFLRKQMAENHSSRIWSRKKSRRHLFSRTEATGKLKVSNDVHETLEKQLFRKL